MPQSQVSVSRNRPVAGARMPHMAKFKLRDHVRRTGLQETRTVEEVREGEGEPIYWIQLGLDFATRVWAKESEIEYAPDFIRPDPASVG